MPYFIQACFLFLFLLTADWLMIKYTGGEKYRSHCQQVARKAVVIVTCDPGVKPVRLEYKLL